MAQHLPLMWSICAAKRLSLLCGTLAAAAPKSAWLNWALFPQQAWIGAPSPILKQAPPCLERPSQEAATAATDNRPLGALFLPKEPTPWVLL